MAKINKNDLGYLGVEFQYRLISAFIHDPAFFRDLNSVIDQNMFTETYLRTIVGVMKEYYNKQESVPSYDMIMIKLREKAMDADDLQYYEEAIEKIKHTPTDGYREIEDMSEKFFFQQNLIKVSNELKIVAGGGDISKYSECRKLLEGALSVGRKSDNTTTPFQAIEDDLSKESIVTIPTGIDRLDEGLGGGLDKGKVGLIICAMGVGKALPNDALVMSVNGPVRIDSLSVGDFVIGRNGKPTMVTGVFPQGIRDIYRVYFSDGTTCRCDKEHLWTVNTLQQRNKKQVDNSFSVTKTLGELMEIGFRSNKTNEYQFRVPVCNAVEYNEQKVDVDAYSFGLSIDERERISNEYLYNSINSRILLLNGLMAVHGNLHKYGRAFFETKNKQIANDVRQLVLSLGGFSSIKKKNNKFVVSVVLCDKTLPVFADAEKQNCVYYSDKQWKCFESVKFIGQMDATCIKVAADDELFLTNDYIVTHNTSMTTCMAANAATCRAEENNYEGYKVLQICFEDKPRDLHRKYISKVTQVETAKLNESEDVTQRVKSILKNSPETDLINNNIQIIKLNTGEVTATDIKNIIKKKANEGFKADLVIIDYFECIEPEIGTAKDDITTREGKTMRKFETMAEELNIALWIPTQGNRDSISAELVTNDKVGGSIRKNQIAQVVLSVTRSVQDIKNKRAALTILKNRSGGAGLVLNGVLFDNGTCTISTDNVIDFDDVFAYNEHVENVEREDEKNKIQEARKPYKEANSQMPF